MTNSDELKIIKLGTVYFIPVNRAVRPNDLEGFGSPSEVDYGQVRLLATSTDDQFHPVDDYRHWVAVTVPSHENGSLRSIDEAIEALGFVYAHLFRVGLVSTMSYPGMIVGSPFDLIPQPV